MKTYSDFAPPFELDFREWNREKARAYFEWFVSHVEERISELGKAMASRFGDNVLTMTPDSLFSVGEFFVHNVASRPLTASEQGAIQPGQNDLRPELQAIVEIGSETLDTTTISLCLDVGIYFAEILKKEHPSLRWDIWKSKSVEMNRPVLVPFKGGPFDPLLIMTNIAFGTLRRGPQPNRLRELYDVWSQMVDE